MFNEIWIVYFLMLAPINYTNYAASSYSSHFYIAIWFLYIFLFFTISTVFASSIVPLCFIFVIINTSKTIRYWTKNYVWTSDKLIWTHSIRLFYVFFSSLNRSIKNQLIFTWQCWHRVFFRYITLTIVIKPQIE